MAVQFPLTTPSTPAPTVYPTLALLSPKAPLTEAKTFSHQNASRARTELILFIRPTVIKDGADPHFIAEETRTKMNSTLVGTSLPVVVVDPPKVTR